MSRSTNYPLVDILRGFAALSVLVYHVIESWNWLTFPTEGPLAWFRIGWLGVDLFFVISGFVIGLSALDSIDRDGIRGFRKPFVIRRLARIVPLYYLSSILFILALLPRPYENLTANILAHAVFVHNFFPSLLGALNAPSWSLGIEMQFYLLVLMIAPRLHGRAWWAWLLALCAIAWGWRFGAFNVMFPQSPGGEKTLWMVTIQLPGTLDEFASGLLLARFLRSTNGQTTLEVMRCRPLLQLLVLGGAAVWLWSAFLLYWSGPSFWQSIWTVTIIRTPLAVSAMLLLFLFCTLDSCLWLKLSAPFRYLGTISYGIYLWHWPVLIILRDHYELSPGRALIYTSSVTIILAAFSWHWFEKPIIKYFAKGRRSSNSAVA